jgi:hypothetical protein
LDVVKSNSLPLSIEYLRDMIERDHERTIIAGLESAPSRGNPEKLFKFAPIRK